MTDCFADELYDLNMPVHMVLDGAIVDNIEDHLNSHGLTGRPLFRETADREVILVAPWLVRVERNRPLIERAVAASRDAGKGVFWLGEADTDALRHHLRRLNAVRVPDGRILYFRHCDSDVLGAIVLHLTAAQTAHFYGPARVLGLVGGCEDGAIFGKAEGLPEADTGPMAFEPWQIEVFEERQQVLSRKKIARILRQECPEQTANISDTALLELVLTSEREAEAINLTSEEAQMNWMRLNLESGGAASRNVVLKNDIAKLDPRQTNGAFMQALPVLLKRHRQTKQAAVQDAPHLDGKCA